VPLSRLFVPDIRAEVLARGLVAEISGTTIWRWLATDAIRPWAHRSWIFPRDPDFEPKAARVLDLYRAKLFGRLEPTTGIAPFGRLVEQVMRQEPYRSARRVFWMVDNGSSHRGMASVRRLAQQWPRAHLVHTPVHSSWLNQVKIYLSIVQRKCLTPQRLCQPGCHRGAAAWLPAPLRAGGQAV
jgi:DDE superfamily endonuclease